MAEVFKKKIAANINKIRAFGLIDNVTSHSILHLLNKPPDRRTRQEIEMYLPNLVHGTNCLRNVQKGTKIHYYSNNFKVGCSTCSSPNFAIGSTRGNYPSYKKVQ